MKLEFLKNINEYNEHAVRLSDFNSEQAGQFSNIIKTLIAEGNKPIDLTSLEFIQPVNCKLTLHTADEDLGISFVDGVNFICELTKGTYQDIVFLLEPFCKKESKGYQWLYDIDNPIGFLFSSGSDMPQQEE